MVQRVEPRSRRCHSSGAAGSRGGHALHNCEPRRSSSSLIDARAFPSRRRRRGRGACTPGAPLLRCATSFSCGRLSSFIEPNARPSRLTQRCASGAHGVASLVVSRMRQLSAQRSFSGKGMLPAPTQRGVRSIVKRKRRLIRITVNRSMTARRLRFSLATPECFTEGAAALGLITPAGG
jgi:hypothetical protein